MFAGNRKGLNFRMSEGMAVIVYGSVSVLYEAGRQIVSCMPVSIYRKAAGRLY